MMIRVFLFCVQLSFIYGVGVPSCVQTCIDHANPQDKVDGNKLYDVAQVCYGQCKIKLPIPSDVLKTLMEPFTKGCDDVWKKSGCSTYSNKCYDAALQTQKCYTDKVQIVKLVPPPANVLTIIEERSKHVFDGCKKIDQSCTCQDRSSAKCVEGNNSKTYPESSLYCNCPDYANNGDDDDDDDDDDYGDWWR